MLAFSLSILGFICILLGGMCIILKYTNKCNASEKKEETCTSWIGVMFLLIGVTLIIAGMWSYGIDNGISILL